MLSDDEKHLVSVLTDDRGELVDTLVFHYQEENFSLRYLNDIWNYCTAIMSSVELQWKVVIEKFGELSQKEIEGKSEIDFKESLLN